jgi:hypothetical protein
LPFASTRTVAPKPSRFELRPSSPIAIALWLPVLLRRSWFGSELPHVM